MFKIFHLQKKELKHGRFLQNSSIKIINASKENLKDIECIIMTMALHEKVVLKMKF